MLRILLDKYGAVSNNMHVIIDRSPSRVLIAGTSWLGFFFEDDEVQSDEESGFAQKDDVALLIQLWRKTLITDVPICYLPFDLSDQCGAALRVVKKTKLYHISRVWSTDVAEGMSRTRFIQAHINWQQERGQDIEWEIAPSSIETGLMWSLAQLEQPVVPLRYD